MRRRQPPGRINPNSHMKVKNVDLVFMMFGLLSLKTKNPTFIGWVGWCPCSTLLRLVSTLHGKTVLTVPKRCVRGCLGRASSDRLFSCNRRPMLILAILPPTISRFQIRREFLPEWISSMEWYHAGYGEENRLSPSRESKMKDGACRKCSFRGIQEGCDIC